MRVLIFTLEYPPFKGGIANYYKNIVENWSNRENIFVLNNNQNELLNNNFIFLKWLPAIKVLFRFIKEKKIDYVLVGNILPLGTVALLISKILKIKYSLFVHGTDLSYSQKKFRKKFLAKIILKNAEYVICNSEFTANLVRNIIKNKKIIIVYPAVNTKVKVDTRLKEKIIKKYNLENKIVLFSIGRLIKRKGVDKVIEIMPDLVKKYNNILFCFAGKGKDKDYLINKIKKEYRKKIIYLGSISDQEKFVWLDLCDIFLQPGREENGNFDGFGIVYLEANLMKKPVIAGNSGGVACAVKDKLNGLLVSPRDKQEILFAIEKLIKDKNLANQLGLQGYKRIIDEFNWKRQVKKLENIL